MPESNTVPVTVSSLPELGERLQEAIAKWDANTDGKAVRLDDVGRLLRLMTSALVIIAANAMQDPKGPLAAE